MTPPNHRRSRRRLTPIALLLWLIASPAFADVPASPHVTAYPTEFFTAARPYSAFDMLALLPGYTFTEADSEVRGFAGSAGNVLIDGSRPAGKHETLETILRRIPANAVSRIELIRAGAPGIDMQGQTLLANVVRTQSVQTRGSAEVSSGFYDQGHSSPRMGFEVARQSEDRLIEFSAARYRTVDDEHGIGRRPRVAPDGLLIRDTDYIQFEGEQVSELAAGYEQALGGGTFRSNASYRREAFRANVREERTFPDTNLESVLEFADTAGSELGMQYQRALMGQWQLDLFGIRRDTRIRGGERGEEEGEQSLVREDSDASESILRIVMRSTGEPLAFEGGIEGTLNVLDSHSALQENGVDVPLPAANVRVEERRGEAFATAIWRMAPRWTLEAGSRFESSELIQTGDSDLRKSFFFPKPRALLSFAPSASSQWRLLVERRVGQLDFADFVSSTSLSSNTVTAGNPDLEPDRYWRAELAWERHFAGNGALVVAVRHDEITDLIDRVPVRGPVPFDGVGNIGDGTRDELQLDISLPLHYIGIPNALLKATALWRHSRTTDPATGERRAISANDPFESSLHFKHDLPRQNLHWGIDVEFGETDTEFHFDQILQDRLGTRVDVFVEYEPVRNWNVRMFANNLTDRAAERERRIYGGVRGEAPLSYIETRSLNIGPYYGLSVRRTFGP